MKSRKWLIRTLDKEFAVFIKKRDTSNGWGSCCTCGKRKRISELQCGHYISRRYFSVRWDERNAAAQCAGCNLYRSGASDEFAIFLTRRYGANILEVLYNLKHMPAPDKFEMEEMLEELRKKVY